MPPMSRPPGLLRDARGLSTAEYVIILALVCIVGFAIWQQFGGSARSSSAGAGEVVNGLATSSHEGEGGSTATGGGPAATSGGVHPDLRDASGVEAEPEEDDTWKLFVVGGVFFGGMILWLVKEKSSR